MSEESGSFFSNRTVFFGDIHNHCGVSYGHGPLEDALENGALQLDFLAVTGHAGWPDMDDLPLPEAITAYHQEGIERLWKNWEQYVERTQAFNQPGVLATFFSYEYHSFRFGDRTVVTPIPPKSPELPDTPESFGELLKRFDAHDEQALLLPHHIGYQKGYRGVNWDSVTDEASPLVEIYSLHGLAETDEGALAPYLHTMGPLNGGQTMQSGLAQGHRFGVTASTDHHSAHPGSYGYGCTAVWATELSRPAIWEALLARRTYAITGDRITLSFAVNGAPLGSRVAASPAPSAPAADSDRPSASPADGNHAPRLIEAEVTGRDALDRVEVLKNNRVIHRVFAGDREPQPLGEEPILVTVYLELGWGEKGTPVEWEVLLEVTEGRLVDVEPRLRGVDVVDPLDKRGYPTRFSSWKREGETGVSLRTMTFGNVTTTTVQTQGMALDIEATRKSVLRVRANGTDMSFPLSVAAERSQTEYLGGFTSPAVRVHRLSTRKQQRCSIRFEDEGAELPEDWYYLRVFQKNGHAAWSSPVWIAHET